MKRQGLSVGRPNAVGGNGRKSARSTECKRCERDAMDRGVSHLTFTSLMLIKIWDVDGGTGWARHPVLPPGSRIAGYLIFNATRIANFKLTTGTKGTRCDCVLPIFPDLFFFSFIQLENNNDLLAVFINNNFRKLSSRMTTQKCASARRLRGHNACNIFHHIYTVIVAFCKNQI